LCNLSFAEANKVSCSQWARFGQPWCIPPCVVDRMHACPVCPALVRCCVQVPLMAVLPAAHVALDAHRGVADVAEQGLGFLRNLAIAEANKVSWWAPFGQPWCTPPCVVRRHACTVCHALVRCCVQVPLMAAVSLAIRALSVCRLFQDLCRVEEYSQQLSAAFRCCEKLHEVTTDHCI
jgi:hypothetical protein